MPIKKSDGLISLTSTTSTILNDVAQVWDSLILYITVDSGGGTAIVYFEISPDGTDWYTIKELTLNPDSSQAYLNDGKACFVPHFRITGLQAGASAAPVRITAQWQKPVLTTRGSR